MKRINHKLELGHREGTVLVVTLVCLVIVTAVLLAALQSGLQTRRQLRRELQMEQTQWLLDAAVRKTLIEKADQKDVAPTADGEDIDIEPLLSDHVKASIQVSNENKSNSQTASSIEVIAVIKRGEESEYSTRRSTSIEN